MNFNDLYKKIRAIEENLQVVPNPSGATSVDQAKKLGAMMPAPPGQPDPIGIAPVHTDGPAKEEGIIIGGPAPMPGLGQQGQQDSVNMNVTMSGSGEGGLRNIMNILRNIEASAPAHHEPAVHHDAEISVHAEPEMHHDEPAHAPEHDDILFGDDEDRKVAEEEAAVAATTATDQEMSEVFDDDKEVWGNSAHGDSGHHVKGIDAVTFSGNDMNSKGKISPLARAPGSNTLRSPMEESLSKRLQELYTEIKNR